MKKLFSLCLFVISFSLLTSCSSNDNDTILKYTTDKTLAISRINLKQFDEKLPKEAIAKDTAVNHFSATEKEKLKLFMNAEDNGIDIKEPLYMIADEYKGNYVFSFLLTLDDVKKFETNFSKISDTKVTIDKAKGLIYSDGNIIGSIYDDLILLSKVSNYGNFYNTSEPKADEAFYKEFWSRKSNLDKEVKEQITTSLSDKADASAWVNIHGILSAATKGYIETLAINKLLIHSGISLNLNFEEGKVVMNSNTYFNEDLKKLVEKHYKGKEANYAILDHIDVDDAKSYGVGFISFDFIKYFVKEAGFEATINRYLEYKNLTFADIMDALNGDYAMISYKDKVEVEDDMFGPYEKPSTLFALGINGDKAKKFLDLLHQDAMFSSLGNFYNNNNVLAFATDTKKLELLRTNKNATNSKLTKKSDVTAYSWASGEDFNTMYSNVKKGKFKFVDMVSTSTIKDGNFTAEITVTIDKKNKNAIHYLMGYE